MNKIIVRDNLFDETFIKLFYDFCITENHWFYGRKSALNRDNLIWGSILWEPGDYRNFFVEYIFRKFLNDQNLNAEILSCVLNGQTKGQHTTWHVDLYDSDVDDIDNKYTLIYYVNSHWNESTGSTKIKVQDKEEKIDFVPGRVALFPSSLQHCAEAPEAENLLRITCAYKLKIIGN
jgi:hypothetical protein